jgi:uncharacterized protein (DUF58 family)
MSTGFVLEDALVAGTAGEPGRLQRRRVYIFPTRQGILFGIVLLVMLIGAINYSNSMAYLLAFTLGSVYLVAMLHTYRNLRGLILNVKPAPPVFAGGEARFPLLLDNRGGGERLGLRVYPAPRAGRRAPPEGHAIDVPPAQLQQDDISAAAPARGLLRAGRLRVVSSWPLGLFRAWSYLDSDAEAVVYPRPAGNPSLPEFSADSADHRAGNQEGTDDFLGFRPYRPGDSIRNIDWKALAREQGVLLKRFSGSGLRRLVLHWDQTAYLPDTERRLSQLCLWVLEAERQGVNYGLEIPGTRLPVDHGEQHEHRCLKALATYALAGDA